MSCSPARASQTSRRAACAGVLALALLSACGATVEAPPPRRPLAKQGRVDAVELFPSDLDLVVRLDLGRIRADLGPMADKLFERLNEEEPEHDAFLALALRRAKVVWLGMRLVDLDDGDRLLIVEGDVNDLRPPETSFRLLDPPPIEGVKTFERKESSRRDATSRIYVFANNTIAFATPVEIDSVERVLLRGADKQRRDPSAEGLLSADLRAHRLPATLEKRFPSIASIIGGIESAKAIARMSGEALRVELEITSMSEPKARKVEDLLRVLREGGLSSRYAPLFAEMKIERVERLLAVSISFTPAVMRSLFEPKSDVEGPT